MDVKAIFCYVCLLVLLCSAALDLLVDAASSGRLCRLLGSLPDLDDYLAAFLDLACHFSTIGNSHHAALLLEFLNNVMGRYKFYDNAVESLVIYIIFMLYI